MLYVRADANKEIGTGHVMRCLSIAKAAKKSGNDTCFIIADSNSEEMIISNGFDVICLNSEWNNLDVETERLIDTIKKHKIQTLLIDSYFVTKSYLNSLRKYTKLIYIDDLYSFAFPVDLLINYNIYADVARYETLYKDRPMPRMLLGCQYAPLREEFTGVKRTINKNVSKILVTSGGTDNFNVVGNLLNALKGEQWFSDVDFYCVLGRFNTNIESLTADYADCANVHLLIDIRNIDVYMKMCDVAISAAGSTLYELCACGIPTISYILDDNQLLGAKSFAEKEAILCAGDYRTTNNFCECLLDCLNILVTDYDKRVRMSRRVKELVDGNGAKKIINSIQKIIIHKYTNNSHK